MYPSKPQEHQERQPPSPHHHQKIYAKALELPSAATHLMEVAVEEAAVEKVAVEEAAAEEVEVHQPDSQQLNQRHQDQWQLLVM